MKNIKISGGQLIDRNDGSAVENIHGILTSAAVECGETGGCHLHLVLTDGENQSALRLKYPGDAALKILRCLYGVAAFIKESPVTISMRREEGRSKASIVVFHGERELLPVGSLPIYGDLRNAMSDRMLNTVSNAVSGEFEVTCVVAGRDLDDPDTEEVLALVEGGGATVTEKKFSRPDLATAFANGVMTAGGGRAWCTQDPGLIARIHELVEARNTAAAATGEGAASVVADPEDNEEA